MALTFVKWGAPPTAVIDAESALEKGDIAGRLRHGSPVSAKEEGCHRGSLSWIALAGSRATPLGRSGRRHFARGPLEPSEIDREEGLQPGVTFERVVRIRSEHWCEIEP